MKKRVKIFSVLLVSVVLVVALALNALATVIYVTGNSSDGRYFCRGTVNVSKGSDGKGGNGNSIVRVTLNSGYASRPVTLAATYHVHYVDGSADAIQSATKYCGYVTTTDYVATATWYHSTTKRILRLETMHTATYDNVVWNEVLTLLEGVDF